MLNSGVCNWKWFSSDKYIRDNFTRTYYIFEYKKILFSYQRIKRNVLSKREVNYSPDEKFLLNFLYSYSYNNNSDIEESIECYCFGCNKKIVAKEIVEFDEDLHARCLYCGNRSILADSIDEVLSDYIVELMHRYWF